MNTPTPTATVTHIAREKPVLVLFDDDPIMLKQFAAQYDTYFNVVRVLVDNRHDVDLFLGNGTIRQELLPGEGIAADDWEAQDAHRQVPRSVQSILQEFRKKSADRTSEHNRYDADIEYYEAVAACDYGVKSKDEVKQLLDQIKPNAVLSDMNMRATKNLGATPEAQAADPDVIMGHHVMAMVEALDPTIPKVVHTTKFDIQDAWSEPRKEAQRNLLNAAQMQAKHKGYRIYSKDEKGIKGVAAEVAAYLLNTADKGLQRQ